MCGIAGIVRSDGTPADREVLGKMAALLAHRGPDQEGFYVDPARPGTALAVRRLRVIDPATSDQPLASEDGSVRLVYNGEIYNYRALREGLVARGHALRTQGDGETIVHLWEECGEGLLERLEGMWAMALWDARARRLMLARDRMGQKPLYWRHGPAGLAFSSEIEALLASPLVPRRMDPRAVGNFLRLGYVPAPATGFEGIGKLEPGHLLTFDATTGRLDGPRTWWQLPRGDEGPSDKPADRGESLRAALGEAVRARLVADVPLGVLLSGGLDSSILTVLAAELSPQPVRTFTVRFGERGWDESAYAAEVARRVGAEHTVVDVEPRCVEALELLVRRHGEPFADSSSVAMLHVAGAARRDVVVAISGDGGDEMFGGYPRHAAFAVSEKLGARVRWALGRLGRALPPARDRKGWLRAARRFLGALDLEPLTRYLAWRSIFGETRLEALITDEFAEEALGGGPLRQWRGRLERFEGRPLLDRLMALDAMDYLPNDGLAKVDIASMAHGLEVRCPMLDRRVVALAREMPLALKWRPRPGRPPQGKRVLREAFADVLPARVARRGKMGFGVPVGRWLARDHAQWMREVLLDPRCLGRGIVRRAALARLIDDHTARRAEHGERLWALLCLELWFRTFLDGGRGGCRGG